jgi:hypothetical protein
MTKVWWSVAGSRWCNFQNQLCEMSFGRILRVYGQFCRASYENRITRHSMISQPVSWISRDDKGWFQIWQSQSDQKLVPTMDNWELPMETRNYVPNPAWRILDPFIARQTSSHKGIEWPWSQIWTIQLPETAEKVGWRIEKAWISLPIERTGERNRVFLHPWTRYGPIYMGRIDPLPKPNR